MADRRLVMLERQLQLMDSDGWRADKLLRERAAPVMLTPATSPPRHHHPEARSPLRSPDMPAVAASPVVAHVSPYHQSPYRSPASTKASAVTLHALLQPSSVRGVMLGSPDAASQSLQGPGSPTPASASACGVGLRVDNRPEGFVIYEVHTVATAALCTACFWRGPHSAVVLLPDVHGPCVQVVPGTHAAHSDIRAGECILAVDGIAVAGRSSIAGLILGPANTPVDLTILGIWGDQRVVRLLRQPYCASPP